MRASSRHADMISGQPVHVDRRQRDRGARGGRAAKAIARTAHRTLDIAATAQLWPRRPRWVPASRGGRAAGGTSSRGTRRPGLVRGRACRREQGARDGVPHVCDTYAACPRGLGQPVASAVAAVALGFGRFHERASERSVSGRLRKASARAVPHRPAKAQVRALHNRRPSPGLARSRELNSGCRPPRVLQGSDDRDHPANTQRLTDLCSMRLRPASA